MRVQVRGAGGEIGALSTQRSIGQRLLVDATEVAPNRIEVMDRKGLLAELGMETELKDKRFVDLRPK